MRTVALTRRVAFSSGHRYWLPELSEAENRALFGHHASPHNHGHNYALYVTAAGPVQPEHGMVVNIKEIDDALQEIVVAKFDGKSINDEVEGFQNAPPTVENLLLYFSRKLRDLPGNTHLTGLRLHETDTLYGEWSQHTMTLTRTYEFAASHRLHVGELSPERNDELFGKCNNPAGHGHNYLLEVTVSGEPDERSGMICDIEELDRVVEREVVERYDHKHFNEDIPEFEGVNPTSEVVVLEIFDRLKGKLPAKLERVRLHETARNIFEVNAD